MTLVAGGRLDGVIGVMPSVSGTKSKPKSRAGANGRPSPGAPAKLKVPAKAAASAKTTPKNGKAEKRKASAGAAKTGTKRSATLKQAHVSANRPRTGPGTKGHATSANGKKPAAGAQATRKAAVAAKSSNSKTASNERGIGRKNAFKAQATGPAGKSTAKLNGKQSAKHIARQGNLGKAEPGPGRAIKAPNVSHATPGKITPRQSARQSASKTAGKAASKSLNKIVSKLGGSRSASNAAHASDRAPSSTSKSVRAVSGREANGAMQSNGKDSHGTNDAAVATQERPATANAKRSEIVLPASYRPSEAEPFMNERHRLYFRQKLLKWKEDIVRQNLETLKGLHDESPQQADPADRATVETDRALELRARDRQRKLMGKIDSALARIEEGSYGYCDETGEPISLKRLDARPIATLSLEAQERRERRERIFRED